MNDISLKKTKFKLTLFFSLIVFFITIFLWFFYFSIKYYNLFSNQKRMFNQITIENTKNLNNQLKIWEFFGFDRPEFEFKRWNKPWFWPKNILNFIVIDKTFENIIFDNINQDITINKDLYPLDFNKTYLIDWYFISKRKINSIVNEYDVYYFDKLNYSLVSYFKDLLLFLLLTSLFSFIVYFIWRKFVEKILQPIKLSFQDMNDFIHNANHELKTPLSVISSNLQLLSKLKIYDEDIIKNSVLEINKASELITVLSELSDIKNLENKQKLDLENELNFIIWEFKIKLEEKSINLNIINNEKIILDVNKNYLHILLSNLIWNAIKYNIDFKWNIDIVLNKNKISISNTWYWIEEQYLIKIFDRFFKADESRNTEWFWIWLSLVKKICDVYKWNILVKSKINEKTTFEIIFK